MKTIKKIIASIILATILAVFVPTVYPVKATGWLTGYSYRKAVTITAQSGAGTNYQVKLLIGKTSGATGENFDLNGHCLDTMLDMRFTASDQTTQLDYWIESVVASGTSYLATVWVEVSADLSSTNQDIYIYYGKADDTGGANGDNTFAFFDDFSGSSLDTAKWDLENTPTITVTGSTCKVLIRGIHTWEGIHTDTAFASGAMRSRVTAVYNGATSNNDQLALDFNSPSYTSDISRDNGGWVFNDTSWNNAKPWVRINNGDISYGTETNTSAPFIIENKYNGSTISVDYEDTEKLAATSWVSGSQELSVGGYDNNDDNDAYITLDWVILRKYQITEPTYASAGSETSNSTRRRFLINNKKINEQAAKVFACADIRNYGRIYRLDAVG